MAGPWEKYATSAAAPQAPAAGPWAKYARPKAEAPQAGDTSVFKSGPATQAAPEKTIAGFAGNVVRDARDIGEGIYNAGRKVVTDPAGAGRDVLNAVDTAGAVISGGLGHAYNDAVSTPVLTVNGKEIIPPIGKQFAMQPGNDMNLASAVGAGLKDRYVDNLGNTLYEHPVQSALDISTLAYGGQGAAARVLGESAMATKALGKVAATTNPFNAVAKPINAIREAAAESRALRTMRGAAPSLDQVVARKDALYNALDNAGIMFDANSYQQMLGRLSSKLKTFRATRAPMTVDAVQNMMTFNGKSPTFRDVEEMLIEAKGILREPGAHNADKAAANIMLNEVNSFFNGAPFITNGSVPARDVLTATREARELARRHILARGAAEMERKSKWYTSGDESGLRNQFAAYGKREGKSLTPLEEKAAKKVVRREGVHGLLGSGGSKLTQVGLLVAGLPTAGIVPTAIAGGLSMGARAASAAMTNAKADQFIKTVLAGREAQEAALAAAKRLPVNARKTLIGTAAAGHLTAPPQGR